MLSVEIATQKCYTAPGENQKIAFNLAARFLAERIIQYTVSHFSLFFGAPVDYYIFGFSILCYSFDTIKHLPQPLLFMDKKDRKKIPELLRTFLDLGAQNTSVS